MIPNGCHKISYDLFCNWMLAQGEGEFQKVPNVERIDEVGRVEADQREAPREV